MKRNQQLKQLSLMASLVTRKNIISYGYVASMNYLDCISPKTDEEK